MRPELLIWDFNGTILNDMELCFAIENEMLSERGMPPITREWYLEHFSFPIRDYYIQMGYTFETESYERVSEVFMQRYNERFETCPLREGVLDALAAFQRAGIPQTLLSVTQQDYIARIGIEPKDALFIGDTDHDFEAAQAVGCPCVLLLHGHQSKNVLSRCGVPIYESAAAFRDALLNE